MKQNLPIPPKNQQVSNEKFKGLPIWVYSFSLGWHNHFLSLFNAFFKIKHENYLMNQTDKQYQHNFELILYQCKKLLQMQPSEINPHSSSDSLFESQAKLTRMVTIVLRTK